MDPFSKSANIILVDDDHEDSMYFEEALKEVNSKAKCSCFYSGSDAFNF